MDEYQAFAGDRADLEEVRKDSIFSQNRMSLSRMNIRKSLSRMKIWWGFAEVSTAFVHKGSRVYNHFSEMKSGTPNKSPTTPQNNSYLQNGYTTSTPSRI